MEEAVLFSPKSTASFIEKHRFSLRKAPLLYYYFTNNLIIK